MPLFHFPNSYLYQIGPLKFKWMTLSEGNCKWDDCSSVSHTVKSSRQDLLPQTPLDFVSSPAMWSKVAMSQSCARHLQLQTYKRSVKCKHNLELLQGVQYQQVLAVDCGRKSRLFPWQVCPDLGTQRESASGDWTSFAVPVRCYKKAHYSGGVTARYIHHKI